ncbi:hypothetical protein BOTBODRAFT_177853 [Botryobasidium botryosum FD-172 SS1]|uniref:CCHC-type domain-containing protein n=1 Tax=Botryobasidium botryosum (strain FD-172 SS1) TaxID=930990 RepID=A0A067M7V0_BOTB1|nr:hypothetical protein BOTBODRAFT_177853 [Botryobasidium botryosum FD-172 SS1]
MSLKQLGCALPRPSIPSGVPLAPVARRRSHATFVPTATSPTTTRPLHSRRALNRSYRINDPLPNQISSPATTAPASIPVAVHHITGQPTYATLDGEPFFCPIACDPCCRIGYNRIPDPSCPCFRCHTLATTTPLTTDDHLIQRRHRLGPITNISQEAVQDYSNYDQLDRTQAHPHPSQENLVELAAFARQRAYHAIESNDHNTARHTAQPTPQDGDMDTSIILPSSAEIQDDIKNALSVHPDADDKNAVALARALSAFLLEEYHPRSTDIPEDVVTSITEAFHFCVPRIAIVEAMLDDPDFMALLATRAPQLLPAPAAPAAPRRPPPIPAPLPAAVVADVMRRHNAANWRPGQAKQAVSYALATASGARLNLTPKRISPFISRKGSNKTATDEATFKPQGRVALQTHGTAVVDRFNNSAQASAIEARVTSVSWSRNGNIILTPQEGISLTTLRMESCPILNIVFGVPFRALFPGEIFSATVRDITLCYGTQGDRYTVDELISQIVDAPANRVDRTTLADNHRFTQSSERLAGDPNQLTIGLIVHFVTKEARNNLVAGINGSHKIVMNGTRYSVVAYKQSSARPVQCIKCWALGHWQSSCTSTRRVCGICASSEHTKDGHFCETCNLWGTPCAHKAKLCINCRGGHPAFSYQCLKAQINADVAQRSGAARLNV